MQRKFSCNINAWFQNFEDAKDYQAIHGALSRPKFDEEHKLWCADPELGLSAFAFFDDESFEDAKENILRYGKSIAVFESEEYKLDAGLDSEDVFQNGKFLFFIDNLETKTYNEIIQHLP